MMRILDRYIAKTIIMATGLATVIIVGVLFLMTLLGELKYLGEGDYGITQAILFAIMRLPNELYQFSPLLILLGCILGLSALSTHKELAVMRASGFSVRQITICVLSAALILILLMGLVGEGVAPNLSYQAEVNKENAKHADEAVVTGRGVWFHVGNNFIHIQHVVGREMLEGVTRYQFDDNHHLQSAYYAKKLMLKGSQWLMDDVVKTSFYHERSKSETLAHDEWNIKINPNLLNVGLVEPSEMSLPKLTKFSRYLEKNGLQSSEYRYDFWRRIFQPLACLIMIFFAIPFVLGTLSAVTLGWRIIVGILAGFTFFISNALLGQLCIVFQVPAIFAAILPLMIFGVLGVFLTNSLVKR